jgi:hypothetical protein
MSATHATHKDQASQVAVRALILESLTESACLVRILSLEFNPLIDPPWRRREELYEESNGNNPSGTSPPAARLCDQYTNSDRWRLAIRLPDPSKVVVSEQGRSPFVATSRREERVAHTR